MADHDERWILNHLIELCRDQELLLRYVASHVRHESARALFAEMAADRARFANDLLPHAQRLGGGDPAEHTTRGTLQRRWMEVRETLLGHSDDRVITEVERAEASALAMYEDALNTLLPPAAHDVVEQQSTQIRLAHARASAFLMH